MLYAGITGKMYRCVYSMYEVVRSRVRVDGKLSEPFQCFVGGRQGESL